ncbi:MAG: hypothetical protein V8T86_03335 [Victivallis sp.]
MLRSLPERSSDSSAGGKPKPWPTGSTGRWPGDDRFFDDGKGNFTSRAAFFRNYEFVLTPDEWEIQEGILFPGHRFAAYVSPAVFPSEAPSSAARTASRLP